MLSKTAIAALFISVLSVVTASPIPQAGPAAAGAKVTPQIVVTAAPGSAGCDGSAPCRTADQAAPLLQAAFDKYGFNTPGEQAAIMALMAFETGDFKFDVNVSPGRPGQGSAYPPGSPCSDRISLTPIITARNMMTFPFIAKYALETPDVAPKVASIAPGINAGMSIDQLNQTPPDTMNAVRALVLRDDLSFASAAWFLRTKCSPDIATGLASASAAAWSRYMTACVFTSDDPARLEGYRRALRAYGV